MLGDDKYIYVRHLERPILGTEWDVKKSLIVKCWSGVEEGGNITQRHLLKFNFSSLDSTFFPA